jgi:hypothetical protein
MVQLTQSLRNTKKYDGMIVKLQKQQKYAIMIIKS